MDVAHDEVVAYREVIQRFGAVEALAGLTLEIGEGEIFGLVGPDGAGKTTALELVCGLRRPSAGAVRVCGLDPALQGRELADLLGFVSQDFTLYGTLTVEENLDFFAEIHAVPRALREERKGRLFAFSRLERFADRRAENLSGGMKKKLALCCALIHEPRLLVLDEPTTGVDPVSRRELWEIIFGFLESGITVLATTPYMDEAEQFHRLGLLAAGRLLAAGSPERLRELVDGELLRVRGRPLRRMEALAREVEGFLDSTSFGDRVHLQVRSRERFLPGYRKRLRAAGVEVEEIRPVAATLEDVFLAKSPPAEAGSSGGEPIPAALGQALLAPASEPAVRVEGLERRFGDFTAVGGIDLEDLFVLFIAMQDQRVKEAVHA